MGGGPDASAAPEDRRAPDVPDEGGRSGTGPPDAGDTPREAANPKAPDGRPPLDPVRFLADLYQTGPVASGIWERAGGDPGSLDASGDANAQWAAALRKLRQGGGGPGITAVSLLAAVEGEFANNPDLLALGSALANPRKR